MIISVLVSQDHCAPEKKLSIILKTYSFVKIMFVQECNLMPYSFFDAARKQVPVW